MNKFGKTLNEENYDVGVNAGGYVPRLRNKLFFFGSFNPSVRREIVRGASGSGLERILGNTVQRYRTLNYALKLDYVFNRNSSVTFSIFGDPTKTNLAPIRLLNIDNTTANSKLDFGTRNTSVRYSGTLSPTWILSGSFSQGQNHFDESEFANFSAIIDRTQPARGNFRAIGLGFFEPSEGTTYRLAVDTSKQISLLGTHTLGVGYQYQRALYKGIRANSSPSYTMPATNATGVPLTSIGGPLAATLIGQQVNANFNLFTAPASCTLCPFLSIPGVGDRRVFLRGGGLSHNLRFDTRSNYHAAYVQDTWRINRFVTALLGLRTEQERLIGTPGPQSGKRPAYSFTDQWAPRLGVTVDPLGRGKTKAYYNFGRFFEYIPLDLPERSLTTDVGFGLARFAPDFFIDANGAPRARVNEFGTVIPIVDAAHLLNRAAGGTGGGIGVAAQDPVNFILPGTKLGFTQEHIIGFEQQLPRGFVLSVRYMNRQIKRIVEDAAVVSPEAASFFGQFYFIGNVNSKLDAAVNPVSHVLPPSFVPVFDPVTQLPTNLPGKCDPHLFTNVFNFQGSLLGFVCYEALGVNGRPAGSSGGDGVPDGFPDPVHKYAAVEIELNKRFSNNWQLLSNWRMASLKGNFEGHFRNDNGQTDPAISSLFDFTEGDFGLLGDQNAVGPLNTDRRHVVNIYSSYAFSQKGSKAFRSRLKGLHLGAGLHMESGVPISEFLAHPVYLNAGEVPVGGRGKLGRTPFFAQLDLHGDYSWKISERLKLRIIADFFNVTNNRRVRLPNQFRESTAGQLNPDFLQPQLFHLPFNMRLGARLEW